MVRLNYAAMAGLAKVMCLVLLCVLATIAAGDSRAEENTIVLTPEPGSGNASMTEALRNGLDTEPTVAAGIVTVEEFELVEHDGQPLVQVTVRFPYLDMDGETRSAQARLWAPAGDEARGLPAPLVLYAHYEQRMEDVAFLCARGCLVATPHANTELFSGNSDNLNLALARWLRRLPMMDRQRFFVTGGSAGGYMTLVVASEMFPVAGAAPIWPLSNWNYSMAFFLDSHDPAIGDSLEQGDQWFLNAPVPVLAAIVVGAPLITSMFGEDPANRTYKNISPVSWPERITCPVLVAASTADVLVPMPQFSHEHYHPPEEGAFPEGFQMDPEQLVSDPAQRKPFVDRIPARYREVFEVEVPGALPIIEPEDVFSGAYLQIVTEHFDAPFSRDRQWSFVMFDEGPPTADCGHQKYLYTVGFDSFLAFCLDRGTNPGQLTAAKLKRLVERYQGDLSRPPHHFGPDGDWRPTNRLGYDMLEKLDVTTALLDYADQGWRYRQRLGNTYRQLPANRRPWGDTLRLDALRKERAQLLDTASKPETWNSEGNRP